MSSSSASNLRAIPWARSSVAGLSVLASRSLSRFVRRVMEARTTPLRFRRVDTLLVVDRRFELTKTRGSTWSFG